MTNKTLKLKYQPRTEKWKLLFPQVNPHCGMLLLWLLIQGSLFLPEQIQAQSLDDYLLEAAENNPGLKASYLRYEAALERSHQPSLPDPELQAGVFLQPMERFMGNQSADFRLMQMFPWFGMISTQKKEANQMAQAQYQLFLEEKNRLFFQIKRTWYEMIRLREEIEISQENLEFLKKYEELALMRFKSGTSGNTISPSSPTPAASSNSSSASSGMSAMGNTSNNSSTSSAEGMGTAAMSSSETTINAVLQIKIEIKELENSIEQLHADEEPLKITFNQLLNRGIDAKINLPSQLVQPQLSLQKQEILDSIWQNNPMLEMYDAEIGAYQQQAKMANLEGKPMLGAGVNYMTFAPRPENGMFMGGENMIMPMVNITLPIYRKKIKSKIKEAELLQESKRLERNKTENLLAMEWAEAFRTWEESERNLSLYEAQIELVNQQIQLLETAYASNATTLENVLQAHQQLLNYQLKRINAINNQYQSLALLEALVSSSLLTF
ncbi:Outer membrane protein TolC [Algoriphagus faecimaris]|uniref:Outer membrane protein TolC n=1 Tax=Algoriphagus faecimaris TaxID=686796 RepID=A0A1G6RJ14_9BACT|nr:TolC family protein [Algoriphagus faecimaris]SDD04364.1 Outer membrane protein TolC [Algoriphagus faecimaris]